MIRTIGNTAVSGVHQKMKGEALKKVRKVGRETVRKIKTGHKKKRAKKLCSKEKGRKQNKNPKKTRKSKLTLPRFLRRRNF